MMMSYGMFVFSLDTAAYQELQRQTQWRHSESPRVGERPTRQYLGPGSDEIQVSGTLYPQLTGGQQHLDQLRAMADEGKAWPLVEGSGRMYGLYVITALSETGTRHFPDGAAQAIEFQLSLARVDDERQELIGSLGPADAAALIGGVGAGMAGGLA